MSDATRPANATGLESCANCKHCNIGLAEIVGQGFSDGMAEVFRCANEGNEQRHARHLCEHWENGMGREDE